MTDEGADRFEAKINIEVQYASEQAIAAVERNGGVIKTAYFNLESVIALSNPLLWFSQGKAVPKRLHPPAGIPFILFCVILGIVRPNLSIMDFMNTFVLCLSKLQPF